MIKYIIRRIIMIIPVILGVLTIVFVLSALTPGDPVTQLLGTDVTEEVKEAKRVELGLDKPLVVQYVRYIWRFFTKGDLGTSYTTKQPVLNEILSRFPYSFFLGLMSSLISVIIAVPLGILSAVKKYSVLDNVIMALALFFVSIPQFWLGLMCIRWFGLELGWVPTSGVATWKGWILPILILALGGAASITRITRSSMLEVIEQDYMRTAKAKGQRPWKILMHHGLKNALIPIIAAVGATVNTMFAGSVFVESVFGLPGIGKYMTDAITQRNWPAVQGGVIFIAICLSIINLILDLIYVWVDPRLQSRYNGVRAKEIRKLKREMQMNKRMITTKGES